MKIQEKYSTRCTALYFGVFCLLICSCGQPAHNADGVPIADSSIRNGRELASRYCQSCHVLPDPGLLDKASWQRGVLPGMGPRLGIFVHNGHRYPSYANDPNVGRGFYPAAPLLAGWQWQEIIDYYSGTAPDSMPPQPEHKPIRTDLTRFKAVVPAGGNARPLTSYVHVDTAGGRRQLITGSLFPGIVWRYDMDSYSKRRTV